MSQSFKRGLMILDLFPADRTDMTLEEIANELDVSEITVYRYVKILEDFGMVAIKNGKVQLSVKILRFANMFWQQDQLVSIAKDYIVKLNNEFNETIALCKLEENDVVCLYNIESSLNLRSSFSIGQRMSLHAGAFARSIAAFLPKTELKTLIRNFKWEPFTKNTIISRDEYEKRLEEIRIRGYDISKEEVVLGVIAIAAPIKLRGRAIASLGLGMPTVRNNTENMTVFVNKLKESAEFISNEISSDPFFRV